MPALPARNLNAVSRTLMIPLYIRAMESRRPDALLRDPKALELVGRGDDRCNFRFCRTNASETWEKQI